MSGIIRAAMAVKRVYVLARGIGGSAVAGKHRKQRKRLRDIGVGSVIDVSGRATYVRFLAEVPRSTQPSRALKRAYATSEDRLTSASSAR